jgi:hypothetical protein
LPKLSLGFAWSAELSVSAEIRRSLREQLSPKASL